MTDTETRDNGYVIPDGCRDELLDAARGAPIPTPAS